MASIIFNRNHWSVGVVVAGKRPSREYYYDAR
jgi:hypothetical protein